MNKSLISLKYTVPEILFQITHQLHVEEQEPVRTQIYPQQSRPALLWQNFPITNSVLRKRGAYVQILQHGALTFHLNLWCCRNRQYGRYMFYLMSKRLAINNTWWTDQLHRGTHRNCWMNQDKPLKRGCGDATIYITYHIPFLFVFITSILFLWFTRIHF